MFQSVKLIYILFMFFIGFSVTHAQFGVNNILYYTGDVNLGNYVGIDLSLNYAYQEKYAFKIGYSGNIRFPKSQPENYRPGLIGVLLFMVNNPYDQLVNYHIGFGKMYKLNPKKTIRANISVGLGYTIITEPENWEYIDNGGIGENYNWNYGRYRTISLIINPKIEFPFTKYFGFAVSPMVQINKDRIYFGIGVGNMLGLLRTLH